LQYSAKGVYGIEYTGTVLLYGAIGGLIIVDALKSPPVDKNDPDASTGFIDDLKYSNMSKQL